MDHGTNDFKQVASSRRAVLLGVIGGIGAWTAGALGRVAPAQAADGDIVNVGADLTGTTTTRFTVPVASTDALSGNASGGGNGVGVRGSTSGGSLSAGVLGVAQTSTGVRGVGGHIGVEGSGVVIGVKGDARYSIGETSGVVGESHSPDGAGVLNSGRSRS